MTPSEARAALPTIADMPTGWSVDPEDTLTGEDEDENDSKILPARCERVFEGLDHVKEKTDPAAESGVTYMGGAIGPFLGVEISSHEEAVSDQLFKDVLTAFDRCSQFKVDDGQEKAQVSASPLSFPNVGDESIAIRFDMDSQSFTAGFDLVAIRVGHNVIGLSQLGIGGAPDVKPLVKAAKTTMQKLSR